MVAYINISFRSSHPNKKRVISRDLFLIGMELFDCKGLFEIKI